MEIINNYFFLFKEFCRIPAIHHGEVMGQKESLLVPHGFRASVKCFALHKISSSFPMRCYKGEWSHIPKCSLGKFIIKIYHMSDRDVLQ